MNIGKTIIIIIDGVLLVLGIASGIYISMTKNWNYIIGVIFIISLGLSLILFIVAIFIRKKIDLSWKIISILIILPFLMFGVFIGSLFLKDRREVVIIKEKPSCPQENQFLLSDRVKLNYNHGKKLGVTKLYIWYSECKSISEDSCYNPFKQQEDTVYPDWEGFEKVNYIPLWYLFNKVGFYKISIIMNDKLQASRMLEIVNSCK